MPEKRILIGFNNPDYTRVIINYQKPEVLSIESVSGLEEMLARTVEDNYHGYLMDLTLGNPLTLDISPAIQVYQTLRPRIKRKEAKFLGLSANHTIIRKAGEAGIPALDKMNFVMEIFLRSLEQLSL
jgi:hypothetical protein